ncbi:MAG: DUF5011 domain-containing protein [Nitrosopumilus sp. D6]|nr:MAG: DUF5011 domain-containing protein [Nitrosopumilus sp. D6]
MSLPIAVLFLVTLVVAFVAPFAHADVAVTASAYGKSVIIEIASGSEDVRRLHVWLTGGNLDSFKVENGWTGEEMPDGSILFVASDAPDSGTSTTFGIVADSPPNKINWQADGVAGQIGSGAITLISDVEPKPDPVFRIIPEMPNIGSTIRVIGQSLLPSTNFDFYINNDVIGTFTTNRAGYFAGTAKIPQNLSPGNTEFRLGNGEDAMTFSIRMDYLGDTGPSVAELELDKVPDMVHRGDSITLQGTGNPNTRIIIEVKGPEDTLENSLISETDAGGRWSADPIKIGFDAPFGSYTVTVTDGRHSKKGSWSVESDRVMNISPVKKILNPGEVIMFTGTALPNEQIRLAIENPDGNKVGTEIITTDDSGRIEFEYPTSADSKLGPYTLIAVQGDQIEFVHTSLGVEPKFNFNLELDKNTYSRDETVVISLSGDQSETLNLTILGENGATRGTKYVAQVQLDPEGRGLHHVYLNSNYTEGTYTARLSKGNIADEEHFGVDLVKKSADLVISPVKEIYARGETLLIIGNTLDANGKCTRNVKNIQIIIRLVDPDGKVARAKPTFIDNNCGIIDRSFTIPNDANLGTWKIISSIKTETAFHRSDTGEPTNRTTVNRAAAAGPSYDGCVPATDLGKLVLLACRKNVDGPDPTPVLRLINKAGTIVWEGETALVDSIFNVLNETRGEIQGLEPVIAKKAVKFDHDCGDPIKRQPPKKSSQSNQTKIDLLGVKTVVCSHGQRYNAPVPVCTGVPGADSPKHNASAIDRFMLGEQVILFTCGSGINNTDSATRIVTIVDRAKPKISLSGRTVDTLFKNAEYTDPGATCTDEADKNPLFLNSSALLNRVKLGKQKITYTCIDAAGNKDIKSRTITILDPCNLQSYVDARGEIGRPIVGCGGAGTTLIESSFEVVDIHDKNLRIRTEDGGKIGAGDLINVIVTGSNRGTTISITYENDKLIQEYVIQDPDNEIIYHWLVDRHIEPGTYKIIAAHENQRAETEYHIPLR